MWTEILVGTASATTILCIWFYRFMTKNFGRWEKEGIPAIPGAFPHGSYPETLDQKRHLMELVEETYHKFKGAKVSGFYLLSKPILMINDVDLIRNVLVKDFNYFVDRQTPSMDKIFRGGKFDEYWRTQLTSLNGDEWKDVRSTFSPIFTSGKMKGMMKFIREVGRSLTKEMESLAVTQEDFELKKVFGKFSLDALANCAFGINPKSFEDESGYFVKAAARIFTNTGMDQLKMFTRMIPGGPLIHQTFGIDIFKPKETKFFIEIIKESVAERRKTGSKRNDIIDLMIECMKDTGATSEGTETEGDQFDQDMKMNHKRSKMEMTEDLIVSTAMVMLVAGYDTTGLTLSCLAYYLSLNPDIQARFQEEVDEAYENNGGRMPEYSEIMALPYMETCILETMRMQSSVGLLLRACVKDYNIPGTDITLKKEDMIGIPSAGLHHDEDFYPDPYTFNPDNFSKEAKQARSPYAFMAFGQGPRACMGMRFAMMEMKMALCEIFHTFTFLPSDKTAKELKPDPTHELGYPIGGLWAKVQRRNSQE